MKKRNRERCDETKEENRWREKRNRSGATSRGMKGKLGDQQGDMETVRGEGIIMQTSTLSSRSNHFENKIDLP